jgi:polar amino acid transport system substrate-binding protein
VRQQYLQAQGFQHLQVAGRWDDNVERVINRKIDLIVLAEFDLAPMCGEHNLDCTVLEKAFKLDALSTGLYLAYSQSTPDPVVLRTRAAFDKLKVDGMVDRLLHR